MEDQKNLQHKPRIVYVDDERSILSTLKRLTKSLDAESVFFNNSDKALEYIRDNSVDIVLSDMSMPYMDGLTLLTHIAEEKPEILRIMFTGYTEPKLLFKAVNEAKVWAFIEKPWDNQQLIQTLESAIQSRNQTLMRLQGNYLRLEAAKSDAETDSRLKNEFLAMMSHELRTPLTAINGALDLLSDTELNAEQRLLLERALVSGKELTNSLTDIINYSKFEAGYHKLSVKSVNLCELAASVVASSESKANHKNLSLNLNCALEPDESLFTDPYFVKQILNNLISNAIKFTNSGGIDIRIEQADNSMYKVSVKDTGVGIDNAHLDEIFNKFTQVHRSYDRVYGGSGLGLAICKQLTEKLSGSIICQSQPGAGSTFTFTLKDFGHEFDEERQASNQSVLNFKSPSDDYNADKAALDALNELELLLVEDSEANQMVIRSILQRYGISVDIASDGFEAIQAVKAKNYSLILMDLSMPKMDGATATRTIREQLGKVNVPIIALTANVNPEDLKYCLNSGMTDYAIKPINKEQLINQLAFYQNRDRLRASDKSRGKSDSDSTIKFEDFIDQKVLAQLEQDTNHDILIKIIDKFCQELLKRRQLILNSDEDMLHIFEKEAHAIKSSAATLGAYRLSQSAKTLEAACKANQHDEVVRLRTELLELSEQTLELFSSYD